MLDLDGTTLTAQGKKLATEASKIVDEAIADLEPLRRLSAAEATRTHEFLNKLN